MSGQKPGRGMPQEMSTPITRDPLKPDPPPPEKPDRTPRNMMKRPLEMPPMRRIKDGQ